MIKANIVSDSEENSEFLRKKRMNRILNQINTDEGQSCERSVSSYELRHKSISDDDEFNGSYIDYQSIRSSLEHSPSSIKKFDHLQSLLLVYSSMITSRNLDVI